MRINFFSTKVKFYNIENYIILLQFIERAFSIIRAINVLQTNPTNSDLTTSQPFSYPSLYAQHNSLTDHG